MDRTLPTHVGYIVDGNRRWARSHGLPTYEGHLAGYNTLLEIIFDTLDAGVEVVSLYAFSTENWKRGEGETGKLMKLALRVFKQDIGKFIDRGIRVRVLGTDEGLSDEVVAAGRSAEQLTEHLTNGTVVICFNYGGHKEIADAARQCVADGLTTDEITEDAIAQRLYHADIPPVDLVVRTSGEQRLSNFMLWRTAYSEFIFVQKFWPDMKKADVEAILEEYSNRSRRYGG